MFYEHTTMFNLADYIFLDQAINTINIKAVCWNNKQTCSLLPSYNLK